jgi:hypothetical protein
MRMPIAKMAGFGIIGVQPGLLDFDDAKEWVIKCKNIRGSKQLILLSLDGPCTPESVVMIHSIIKAEGLEFHSAMYNVSPSHARDTFLAWIVNNNFEYTQH